MSLWSSPLAASSPPPPPTSLFTHGWYEVVHDGADHGCSYVSEYFNCVHTDEGSKYNHFRCHATTEKVGLRVILPLVLALVALFAAYTYYRYRQLRQLRETQALYSEAVAYQHGKFAAGADSWRFGRDLLPYLVPSYWRTWCIVETIAVRIMLTLAALVAVLMVIFFSLGYGTTAEGETSWFMPDSHHLGAVAWYALLPLFTVLCCVPMCMRCFSRAHQQRRFDAMQQMQPPIQDAIVIQDPNFPQQQQQQQQQPQQHQGQVHLPVGGYAPNTHYGPLPTAFDPQQPPAAAAFYGGQPMQMNAPPSAYNPQYGYAPPPMRS